MGVKSFFKELFKKKEVKQDEAKKIQVTESQQKYYNDLQRGYRFIQFIYDDIDRAKKQQVNRAQRRRFEKKLKSGRFSREMVDEYGKKIIDINQFIKEQDIISDKQAELNKEKAKKEAEKKQKEALKKKQQESIKKIQNDNKDAVDGKEWYDNLKKKEQKIGYNPAPKEEKRPDKPTPPPPSKD